MSLPKLAYLFRFLTSAAVMAAAMTSALGGRDDKLIAANRAVLEYVERKHNDLYMLLQTSMPVS